MSRSTRDRHGRFVPGCPGGPGRPRRAVEADYLRALGDAVSLADWAAIVRVAVDQAKAGDGKARDWLARYLIGETPPSLMGLAADPDGAGLVADIEARQTREDLERLMAGSPVARLMAMTDEQEQCDAIAAILDARDDDELETALAAARV